MTVTDPTSRTPDGAIDTSAMVCVHVFLRREFRLAGGVVRGVHPGDTRRAAVVADHLAFLTTFLHHHHTAEDRLLWPRLLARVPDELAPIVRLMESQHELVDGLLQQMAPLRTRWRATATAADRDALAQICDALYAGLSEHLDAEEQRLLPIAARTVTLAEWGELGEAGVANVPRKQLPLVLGMFQYEGDPAVVAQIVGEAPALIRLVVPRLARRAFRKHALAVYGTATP
jgi:hemerythrin-like domain-containing protein